MKMGGNNILSWIEKLKGRENYSTWKFAMENYFEHEGLQKCIDGSERDAAKLSKAKTTLNLSIEKENYVHVLNAKTAKEAWDKLKETFEDNGMTRRISLMRKIVGIKLENCKSMEHYVSEIISTAHKLNEIGFAMPDEWVVTFLLTGLTDEFGPMIMALENVSDELTSDEVKSKLLQQGTRSQGRKAQYESSAMVGAKKEIVFRCYSCNEKGHKSYNCKNKPKSSDSENERAHIAASEDRTSL